MPYAIKLDNFEGPLDLLLHLIKKHEMDIYDIPIAVITDQYLATLDAMKSLNLDVAGEFLVVAATLIHIKSKMLLPFNEEEEGDDEEVDPRAELVRRLLEYQKYKEAALTIDQLPTLSRDVFVRGTPAVEPAGDEEPEFESVGLFDLVEAFRRLLKEHPEMNFHDVSAETLSVADKINGILDLLKGRESLNFADIFADNPNRQEVVVSFLAMLELVKLRLVRLMQNVRFGPIWLFPAVTEDNLAGIDLAEDELGYQ